MNNELLFDNNDQYYDDEYQQYLDNKYEHNLQLNDNDRNYSINYNKIIEKQNNNDNDNNDNNDKQYNSIF